MIPWFKWFCRYPETRVPLTTVWRRSTHVAIFSRVVKELCVRPGRDSPQLRVTTLGQQQLPTRPCGWLRGRHVAREGDILQGITSGSGPPWESAGPQQPRAPGMVQDLHVSKSDPSDGIRTPSDGIWTPLCGVRTAHSMVPGIWDREYPGLNQGQAGVRRGHVSRPYRIHFCSSPRRRPDAAAWPTARDVSQWARPDVRPLGCAASAFIVDKAHCLSIPLVGDVPPRHLLSPVHSTGRRCAALHLLSPVHSAGRRRPVHSAGGVPVHSTGRQYTHTAACTTLIITRTLPRKQPPRINTVRTADIRAPGDCSGVTCISYSYNVFLPFCSWAHMSGLSILVCASLQL
jgi:hypothetical protein